MLHIAVTCADYPGKRATEQFAQFLTATGFVPVMWSTKTNNVAIIRELQFHRVTTELDVRGFSFDGVVRLSELDPVVEQKLIASMRPPIPEYL